MDRVEWMAVLAAALAGGGVILVVFGLVAVGFALVLSSVTAALLSLRS